MNLFKIIFTHKEVFSTEQFKNSYFYGCGQKNNNNIFLQLDLFNRAKDYLLNEVSKD